MNREVQHVNKSPWLTLVVFLSIAKNVRPLLTRQIESAEWQKNCFISNFKNYKLGKGS